jgi:hypothetical protein
MFQFETVHRRATRTEHFSVTAVLFIATVAASIFITNLGSVYALVGGTFLGNGGTDIAAFCSTCIAYLLPGAAAIAIFYSVAPRSYRFILGPFKKCFQSKRNAFTDMESDSLLGRDDTPVALFYRVSSVFVLIFGILAMFIGTGTTLAGIISS